MVVFQFIHTIHFMNEEVLSFTTKRITMPKFSYGSQSETRSLETILAAITVICFALQTHTHAYYRQKCKYWKHKKRLMLKPALSSL